jgi:ech hydrogenase subunit A
MLLPALCSVLTLIIKNKFFRNFLVILTLIVLVSSSIMLWVQVAHANGKLTFAVPINIIEIAEWVVKAIDVAVLLYVIFRGVASRKGLAPTLALIQMLILGYFEIFVVRHSESSAIFVVDYLSLVLVLLASIIGPLIIFFGIGYMQLHEEHLHLKVSKQPVFFAVLFAFLSAMNGIAMCDSLVWMYTFWEVTTLCSFLLIGHDQTEEAIKNSFRALDLNMLGGVAFAVAILIIYNSTGTVSVQSLVSNHSIVAGGAMLGVALLCFAGLTKSAQFPFQSWLLGAMVAPTPVSAILHSSTMVKAGVFIIVRLATLLAGTGLGNLIAVAGGFTFLAASAIAISQSNGKKVLAYSTIANLGLIICCAGIGSPAAIGAAILLMIYHAISKGLLFLCIGTIEQGIGSRDIEDMQGLMKKMPYTTFIMVIGMISMLLPPFGVLITKWLAIETAVDFPLVLILLIMGSAFTVVFWAKWIGITLTMSYKKDYYIEKLRPSMSITLAVLIIGVLCATGMVTPMFNSLIKPYLDGLGYSTAMTLSSSMGDLTVSLYRFGTIGGVLVAPLLILVLLLVILVPLFLIQTRPEVIKPPYFGGELANNDIRGIEFIGPGDKVENIVVHNYYMTSIFGEDKLTIWMSIIAGAIILIMFGVVK